MSLSNFGLIGRSAAALLAVCVFAGSQASAQLPCVGDCNGDGSVAVNELITGVNINLGNRPVDDCLAFDANEDGQVAINELIQGVNANLQGCESAPTATPDADTPTATPDGGTPTPGGPTATETATEQPTATVTETAIPPTPTATEAAPTSTPNDVVEPVAGASGAVVNSLSSIANIVGAVVAGASGGTGGGGAVLNGLPGVGAGGDLDPCELGGTVLTNIEVVVITANITIEFSNCRVSRPGGSVMFDGIITVTGLSLQLQGNAVFDATITFMDEQGTPTAITDADIESPVALTAPIQPGPCTIDLVGERRITGVDLTQVNGSLASSVPNEGDAEVVFLDTSIELDILDSGPDCVPTEFDLLFDGDAQISQATNAQTVMFDLEFIDFLLNADQDGGQSTVTMTGDISAACFGGTVSLSTPDDLSFLLGTFCPGSGTISVQDVGDIVYSASGVMAGGQLYPSCLDPALLAACAM